MAGRKRLWRIVYFYPRSPCGERPALSSISFCSSVFLSTLSLRRATKVEPDGGGVQGFLSTLSLRRATQTMPASSIIKTISIHALLAESDPEQIDTAKRWLNFYPRSPCGERLNCMRPRVMTVGFLSTLSLRRATLALVFMTCPPRDFYPRSPCGERLGVCSLAVDSV